MKSYSLKLKVVKLLVTPIFLCLITFILPNKISAQDFRADYNVEYFLSEKSDNLETTVNFNVQIANLKSDLYVNKFSIAFPKTFLIKNLVASDDRGGINPEIEFTDDRTKISLEFSNPNVGRGSVNNFYLKFLQDNLFKINGNIWEVILPTIENKESGSYNVIVNLPNETDKKISIAKPIPSRVSGKKIYWDNPNTKTIYAVFGDTQYYQLELTYNLQNPKLTPVYTDVAFPPETVYQKLYIEGIKPLPQLTYLDEDGNFMARYFLNPKEKKTVVFNGFVKIFSQPRWDIKSFLKNQFENQKKYLLTEQNYWQLDQQTNQLEKINKLKTVSDVYYFVTNNLKYDYQRVSKDTKRLGAKEILSSPNQAVCTDFSDLFIALSREKGIYSREVEGYGFSNDSQLRPLSLISDVLHSWPEYYNDQYKLWQPVDPTWENTSGIDYFSSFDLNHIVFVIHGKKSDYPLAAGMYKIEDSRDITIKAVNNIPSEKSRITLDQFNLPGKINDRQTYKVKMVVKNEGNVFLYNIPIKIDTDSLTFSNSRIVVTSLLPLESKELVLEYRASQKNKRNKAKLAINVLGEDVYNGTVNIYPYYFEIGLKLVFFGLIATIIFLLYNCHKHYKFNKKI